MRGVARLLVVLVMVAMVAGGSWAKSLEEAYYRDIPGDYAFAFAHYCGGWLLDPWLTVLRDYHTDRFDVYVAFCPTIPQEKQEELKPYIRQVLAWVLNIQNMRISSFHWNEPVPQKMFGSYFDIYIADCYDESCHMYARQNDYSWPVFGCDGIGGVNGEASVFIKEDYAKSWATLNEEILDAASSITCDFETGDDFATRTWLGSVFADNVGADGVINPEPIDPQVIHYQMKMTKLFAFGTDEDKKILDDCWRKYGKHTYADPKPVETVPKYCREMFARLWNDNSEWCPSYVEEIGDGYVRIYTEVALYSPWDDSLEPQYYVVELQCDYTSNFTCDIVNATPVVKSKKCSGAFVYLFMGDDPWDFEDRKYAFKLDIFRLAVDPAKGWTGDLRGNLYLYMTLGWDKKLGKLVLLRWGRIGAFDP